jgi:hypothetical protein
MRRSPLFTLKTLSRRDTALYLEDEGAEKKDSNNI